MKSLDDNRLVRAFSDYRSAGKKGLLPFITAGYPDLQTTETLLKDFESSENMPKSIMVQLMMWFFLHTSVLYIG